MGYVEYCRRQNRLHKRRRRLRRIVSFQHRLKEERLWREQRRMQAHDPKNIRIWYEHDGMVHNDLMGYTMASVHNDGMVHNDSMDDSYLESLIE